MKMRVSYDRMKLHSLCKQRGIKKLAIFGSAVRDDFKDTSDIDILIEFNIGFTPGFLGFVQIMDEISALLGGRKIDLVTYQSIDPRLREEILSEAEVQYDKAG